MQTHVHSASGPAETPFNKSFTSPSRGHSWACDCWLPGITASRPDTKRGMMGGPGCQPSLCCRTLTFKGQRALGLTHRQPVVVEGVLGESINLLGVRSGKGDMLLKQRLMTALGGCIDGMERLVRRHELSRSVRLPARREVVNISRQQTRGLQHGDGRGIGQQGRAPIQC